MIDNYMQSVVQTHTHLGVDVTNNMAVGIKSLYSQNSVTLTTFKISLTNFLRNFQSITSSALDEDTVQDIIDEWLP